MRLSKSLFDNAIKALSFCQMGLMGNCINMHAEAHIYACLRGVVLGFVGIAFSACQTPHVTFCQHHLIIIAKVKLFLGKYETKVNLMHLFCTF